MKIKFTAPVQIVAFDADHCDDYCPMLIDAFGTEFCALSGNDLKCRDGRSLRGIKCKRAERAAGKVES